MNKFWEEQSYKKKTITTVQINLGNLCNLQCKHCHIEASPSGTKNMTAATAEKIAAKLLGSNIKNIEFTGGEPFLNENLK